MYLSFLGPLYEASNSNGSVINWFFNCKIFKYISVIGLPETLPQITLQTTSLIWVLIFGKLTAPHKNKDCRRPIIYCDVLWQICTAYCMTSAIADWSIALILSTNVKTIIWLSTNEAFKVNKGWYPGDCKLSLHRIVLRRKDSEFSLALRLDLLNQHFALNWHDTKSKRLLLLNLNYRIKFWV